jgi:hypothetical protein
LQLHGEKFAKMEGPGCFGGCSEVCFDYNFPISKMDSAKKTGGLVAMAKELVTNSDVFQIDFQPDAQLSAEQKAVFLGSLLLTDYTYFEKGNGADDKCGTDNDGNFYINLFNVFCMGVLCPCQLKCGGGGE